MASEEKTFRSYTREQGEMYAAMRHGYPPELFKIIIDHHTSTGGQLDTVIDVGCGTGQATRDLAPYFAHAIGLDPSEGMISTARALTSSSVEPGTPTVRFEVSAAEHIGSDLEPPIVDGSVDLLAAATAAHWFDMARFWPRAAHVLKPGGTVALWLRSRPFICPGKAPNGVAIQAAFHDSLDGSELQPYRGQTLKVPTEGFEEESFLRKEWNRGNESTKNEGVLNAERTVTPEELEKMLGTTSSVTRWREANPQKVGTEDDILRKMTKRVESLLHEVGVKPGEKSIRVGVAIVLLMVKKKNTEL